jgi:transposase/curved DNA-binding protein CbpA
MLKDKNAQLSIYSILYSRIPENHILKLINNAVDFSFINTLLEKSYCKYYGRPAKEPEMMAKLLMLQYLYNHSDVQVIEEASLNLAYMWFIGISPEEDLPDPSLLAKFRTHRLKETTLDDIIQEIVKQCVEKGTIKGTGISVDATHTKANTIKKVPERVMKHLAKNIFKNLEEEKGLVPEQVDKNIPNYKEITDHNLAKQTMKNYLEKVIEDIEVSVDLTAAGKTLKAIQEAREILNSPKFIEQKGIRSLVDKDARVGYKSKTDSFFGYKVEFAMIPEERMITALTVEDGAYVDGTEFNELYNRTKDCGIEIKEAYGDKAYFRKSILDTLKEDEVKAYIPVSESAYKFDDTRFTYNKDSDQWFCEMGYSTISKKKSKKKDRDSYYYYFKKEVCMGCPKSQECLYKGKKRKILQITVNTIALYEYSKFAKTEGFLEQYKKRASHEWKNGEMKRFHGMDRARGYGLKSMRIQAKLTALAVNLKRIASILSSNLYTISDYIAYLPCINAKFENYIPDIS